MVKKTQQKRPVGPWEPSTIKWNVEDFFSQDSFDRLTSYFPRIKDIENLKRGIFEAAGWYQVLLYDLERPKGSDIKDELDKFSTEVEKLMKAFEALSYDSKRAIEKASVVDLGEDGGIHWACVLPSVLLRSETVRVQHVLAALTHIREWTERAKIDTKPSSRGRPRHDAERETIRCLAQLWEAQTGEAPRKPYWHEYSEEYRNTEFLDLCRDVLQIVREQNEGKQTTSDPLALTKTVRSVLRAGY